MDRWLLKKGTNEAETSKPDNTVPQTTPASFSTTTLVLNDVESIFEESKSNSSGEPTKKKKCVIVPFRDEWKILYKWLVQDDSKQGKKCMVCNSAIVGNKTHIERHAASESHKKAWQSANQSPKLEQVLDITCGIVSENAKKLEIGLALFVAEHNLPFAVLDHLNLLLKTAVTDSKTINKLIINRHKGQKIIKNITGPENTKRISEIAKRQYFSIAIDESTDTTMAKNLAIILRVYDQQCRDRFLTLTSIVDCSASGIFIELVKTLQEKGIPLKNLIGFTADNCAVMMGKNNGVQAKLKELLPKLVVNGCVCHNLNLVSIAAAAKLPDNVDKLLREINFHFCNSSSRKEDFKTFQNYFGVEIHVILKMAATRWLSRQAAIDRILEQWNVLKAYFGLGEFENVHGNENICFISTNLNDNLIHLYFLFLSYALKIINTINLEMQSEDARIHVFIPRMKHLFLQFSRNFISNKYLNETVISNINLEAHHIPEDQIYCGAEAEIYYTKQNLPANLITEFKSNVKQFYITFCDNLRKKINFDDEVLNFIPKFSPENVISGETNSILPLIVKFFPDDELMHIEVINNEFRALADCEPLKKFKNSSISEFWAKVGTIRNELNELMFSNIYRIAQGILSIPHSSANVERIFSFQNLIKTKCRNRLQINTCSALIQTKDLIKEDCCHSFKITKELIKTRLQNAPLEKDELLE